MDSVLKQEWITALRSGKYQQGKRKLRSTTDNTFCCLGVLCDILSNQNIGNWKGDNFKYNDCKNDLHLPSGILHKFKIPADEMYALVIMNDRGKSFDEIADHIEKHV